MVALAAERSRWLGELACAIDEAQRLVWEFGSSVGLSGDALDLYARLEVIRSELDQVRRQRGPGPTPPDRIDFFHQASAFERMAR